MTREGWDARYMQMDHVWIDGGTDERMGIWTDAAHRWHGGTDGQMMGQMDGQNRLTNSDRWTDGWTNGQVDGQTVNRRMKRWTGGVQI